MAAAAATPLVSMGPVGWAIGGGILLGTIFLAKKHHDDNNRGTIHDNHNKGNPNNRGPNGPEHPFYYHNVWGKSKKDAYERALRDGHGVRPIPDGNHFHRGIMRGGNIFKFGNAHYRW